MIHIVFIFDMYKINVNQKIEEKIIFVDLSYDHIKYRLLHQSLKFFF